MKCLKLTSILILSMLSFFGNASTVEDSLLLESPNSWYSSELNARKLVLENESSATAYYNLGTILAAQQKFPEAIWALEKSLKLNPNAKQTKHNLQFCYANLGLPLVWESSLSYLQEKAYAFGIQNWTYLSIVLAFISAGFIFLVFVVKRVLVGQIAFVFAIFFSLFLIFSLSNALYSAYYRSNQTHAIVVKDENAVFVGEKGNKKVDFFLRAGMRYEIGAQVNNRVSLITTDQEIVWVDAKVVLTF